MPRDKSRPLPHGAFVVTVLLLGIGGLATFFLWVVLSILMG